MFSVGANEETEEIDDATDEAMQLDPVDSWIVDRSALEEEG